VCPAYLLFILGGFAYMDFGRQAGAIARDPAAMTTVAFMVAVFCLLLFLVARATRRWERDRRLDRPLDEILA
jgi:hypothetical protein